jgi:hypothetical protein
MQRADTMSHFVTHAHPLVRVWRCERARTCSLLMAAGVAAASSGYVATAAVVEESSQVHAVELTARVEQPALERVVPPEVRNVAAEPLPPMAAGAQVRRRSHRQALAQAVASVHEAEAAGKAQRSASTRAVPGTSHRAHHTPSSEAALAHTAPHAQASVPAQATRTDQNDAFTLAPPNVPESPQAAAPPSAATALSRASMTPSTATTQPTRGQTSLAAPPPSAAAAARAAGTSALRLPSRATTSADAIHAVTDAELVLDAGSAEATRGALPRQTRTLSPAPPPSAAASARVAGTRMAAPPSAARSNTTHRLALQRLEARVQDLRVRGSLPRAQVRRALARLQPELASCQNARADAAVVLAGNWHTHTAIDETGRTRELEVIGPDGARAVSACLARVSARLVVAPPDTGRVIASWDLRFEPAR